MWNNNLSLSELVCIKIAFETIIHLHRNILHWTYEIIVWNMNLIFLAMRPNGLWASCVVWLGLNINLKTSYSK